jgi:hypothetical protein
LAAVNSVRAASPRLGTSLAFGRLVALGASEIALAFSKRSAFHRSIVAGSGRAQLEQALSASFARPVRLRIEEVSAESDAPLSPAEQEAQDREARDRELQARVRSHPAVEAALRILGGQIEHIQPLEGQRLAASADAGEETS